MVAEDSPNSEKVPLNPFKIFSSRESAARFRAVLAMLAQSDCDIALMDCQRPVPDGSWLPARDQVPRGKDALCVPQRLRRHLYPSGGTAQSF